MADEGTTLQEAEKITLFSADNGDVLVWDADDVFTLRTKYRIVGSLIGSLPRKPKQNIYLSLPLLLSKNETTLLLEKDFARLVESPSDPPLPSQEEVEIFERLRKESFKEQIELFDADNEEKEREIQSIVDGEKKPKKRQGRKRRMKDNNDEIKPDKYSKTEDSNDTSKTVQRNENIDKMDSEENEHSHILHKSNQIQNDNTTMDNNASYVTKVSSTVGNILCLEDSKDLMTSQEEKYEEKQQAVHTKSSYPTNDLLCRHGGCVGDSEMSPKSKQPVDSATVLSVEEGLAMREKGCVIQIPTKMPPCKIKDFPVMHWGHPETQIEQIKFNVFKDLWERGYYITSGTKYGGDFLVYLGDPFKFHSSYVVMVMLPSKKIGMLEMISIGRLAATVKKTAVLATVADSNSVIYSSVKWSGIS